MVGYLSSRLVDLGISKQNIFVSEVDTYTEKALFSHRRSAVTGEAEGRFMVMVSMV